ncbi:MAG: glutamine--fructose-6-phosphate transaminase (isomerizing) [Nitrososphaerota archaeon]|nr:glutamine--fructose-6-phosphate transaminase (isomerizing) [Nitrososphaerota archaeon]
MCGIIGCVAEEPVAGILLEGLKRVEYRGYDSVGMATISSGAINVRKGVGRVDEVEGRLGMSKLRGETGMAHCLHPSTYVHLANGAVTTIEKMNVRDRVLSLDPVTMKIVPAVAVKSAHRSPEELIRIRVDSTELVCSENHTMIVARGGKMEEKLASDVTVGDLLIRPKRITVAGRPARLRPVELRRYHRMGKDAPQELRAAVRKSGMTLQEAADRCGITLAYLRHMLAGDRTIKEGVLKTVSERLGVDLLAGASPASHSHGKFVRLPSSTSPRLMQIVGYVLGAGAVRVESMRMKDADLELLSRYRDLFKEVFSVDARILRSRGPGAWVLDVNSVALRNWFMLNFADRKEDLVFSLGAMTTEEVAAFIRGLFDAEGTVSLSAGQLLLRMTDQHLVRTAQSMLLRLGVRGSVRSFEHGQEWNTVWELSVSGNENLAKFASAVGTESRKKMAKLRQASLGTRGGSSYGAFSVPLTKAELRRMYPTPGLNRFLQRDEYFRDGTATAVHQRALELEEGRELAGLLDRFLSSELLFERVNKVERIPADTDVLYDLEVEGTRNFIANCVFTHNSRWATHGGVTNANAHPHASCGEQVAVIHNGIIENYLPLKKSLAAKGHRFKSETDTEVISHLVEDEYRRTKDPLKATQGAVKKLRGQYAIVVMFHDRPDVLTGARKDAPLIVGVGDGKMFLASDVLAFIEHTDRTIFLDNREVVEITNDRVRLVGPDGKAIRREPNQVAWELSDVSKSDFAHYTLKEINEQPKTVVSASLQNPDNLERFAKAIRKAKSLYITASGTSYHAGLLMKFRLNKEAKVRADVVVAGELKEHTEFLGKGSVVVALSQSGETADVMEAVREAKARGAKVYSIVNAVGSSLARESDGVLLLNCGPEVGVAATKSFTAQVVVTGLVVDAVLGKRKSNGFKELSDAVAEALKCDDQIRDLVREYRDRPDFYFVARGYESPVALEGALKLKELSYIHAEGMPASELKHGTLALIEKGTPVVVVNPSGPSHAESLSNAEELRARGADIIGVSDEQDEAYTHFIRVPRVQPKFTPIVEAVPLQLLAYHFALARKNDPDYPRNLAKSVTVK